MRTRIAVLAVAFALACSSHGGAQTPGGLGSAAGLAGAAVTEARRADAISWNAALLGIYDGPVQSTSVLALDIRSLPGGRTLTAAGQLGLLTGHSGAARFGPVARPLPEGRAGLDADVRARWIAVQSRALAISLDTRYAARAEFPDSLAASLGVRGFGAERADETARALISVLHVGRGAYLGELPVLGRVWTGLAVKGWWLHEYAVGHFDSDFPATDVYSETVLRNASGAGADVGVAGFAAGRLWYGVSLSNAISTSFRPSDGARIRAVGVVRGEEGPEFVESEGPVIRADDPDATAVAAARDLWSRSRYPSVLRAGASWQSPWGTLGAAMSEQVHDGGLDVVREPRRSVAWHAPAGALRIAYGWGGGPAMAEAAVTLGRCDRRWTAGLRRTGSGVYGFSLDLSLSDFACNLHSEAR